MNRPLWVMAHFLVGILVVDLAIVQGQVTQTYANAVDSVDMTSTTSNGGFECRSHDGLLGPTPGESEQRWVARVFQFQSFRQNFLAYPLGACQCTGEIKRW